jgi:MFS family permease
MLEKEYSHKEEEKKKIEESKKLSIIEGSAYSVSEGFGLRYVTPFALLIGSNNFHIGILNSLPGIIGNISQILTIRIMEKTSRKKICIYATAAQAFSWLLLALVGVLFLFNQGLENLPILLIIFYSFLVLFGSFGGPAWNSWMKDLVSKGERGSYFGRRNKIVIFVSLLSTIVAGILLDSFEKKVFGFILIFCIAFLGRLTSSYLFTRKYEPPFRQEKEYYFSFFEFLKRAPGNAFGNFVIFISLVNFSVMISSPFFGVYMLKNLSFSYSSFMLVSTASIISTILFMDYWGKEIDKKGCVFVMKFCGAFIFLIPVLWLFSIFFPSNFLVFYLFFVEFFSGYVWAGFNLAASNYIFNTVTRQRIAICTTYFSIITSISSFFGASIGGGISSIFSSVAGISSILFIFILSAVLRLAVYIFMIGKVREAEMRKI